MIVVTGAAGFIGSCMVNKLNNKGFKDIILVDDFSDEKKNKNTENKAYSQRIDREVFFEWLNENYKKVNFVFHLGARTDTAETNKGIFDHLNLNYSKKLWNLCTRYDLPLIYASSAATYGNGNLGYEDDHSIVDKLQPLNAYGESKNEFDKWALQQVDAPYFWVGLKFFNVYGPNEYHKGRMASVIWHAYNQIRETGKMKLFRSHKEEYEDGKQLRDFIYVKDVVKICFYLMLKKNNSGIYNAGTGKARTFYDLVIATFKAMNREPNIEFIDTPADIRENYQYFTEANMNKLFDNGYTKKFYSLEEGIDEYVKNYLLSLNYY